MNELGALCALLPSWPPPVAEHAPRPERPLAWSPSPHSERGAPLLDQVMETGTWADMGWFSNALRKAGVLDNQLVELPGALVLLPFGVRLVERFAALVREAYESVGLAEYDFPFLAPSSSFERLSRVLPVQGRLLQCGTDSQLAEARPPAALCPSGEAVIYDAWRKLVRTAEDLPLRMYRRARFYRPATSGKRSGRSVFRSMESGDIFELHCSFATAAEKEHMLGQTKRMLSALATRLRLPLFWCLRPPWTNQHQVSHWTLGGDVPLPAGSTVQVACLYDQGQIFSRAFEIGVRKDGNVSFAHQLTGAITRRAVLAHLMMGMQSSGELLLHPELAPRQVQLLYQASSMPEDDALAGLADALRHKGLRTDLCIADKAQVRRHLREHALRGTPVVVLVQGRRHAGDRFKVVVTRADTRSETALLHDDLQALVPWIEDLVHNVGVAYDLRSQRFLSFQLQAATGTQARELMRSRRVAVCPLAFSEALVREVGSWGRGEVLGYAHGEAPAPCILTGAPTRLVALLSPRV